MANQEISTLEGRHLQEPALLEDFLGESRPDCGLYCQHLAAEASADRWRSGQYRPAHDHRQHCARAFGDEVAVEQPPLVASSTSGISLSCYSVPRISQSCNVND